MHDIGFLIKVKYSCVHSDNYQSGSGVAVVCEDFIRVAHDIKLYEICCIVDEHINNLKDHTSRYSINAPKLISKEIIETK